ncbi:MAG TPA: succinylglutamate desuccinylase/aspartoacylase family protein [Azospirillaceae bacterium]|nr:succinylglutamate desuccinylase/aspartoacylase family protein [Azospirillaceae bacterium]
MLEAPSKIELTPPDISAYRRGNVGIDYVTRFEAARPGPTVVINGLTHGNEPCGAHAVDFLFRMGFQPTRGRLVLCLANVAAYHTFDPARPLASRFMDEDFNRLWTGEALDGAGDTVELRRARQLRPVFEDADIVLDLHSMQQAAPPLILCGRTDRGRGLAHLVGFPALVVADTGHLSGRRLIDFSPFSDPAGHRAAILVECGQHWRADAADVAIGVTLTLLTRLGMADPDLVAAHLPRPMATGQTFIELTEAITAADDDFTFAADFIGQEVIPRAGTLIGRDGRREVRTPYDNCILIMPSRHPHRGQTAVRLGRIVADFSPGYLTA